MKIFVLYNRDGEILSVSKVDAMPEALNHPYEILAEEESVVEIPVKKEYRDLDTIQFHEKYRVDIKKKKLVKKV